MACIVLLPLGRRQDGARCALRTGPHSVCSPVHRLLRSHAVESQMTDSNKNAQTTLAEHGMEEMDATA